MTPHEAEQREAAIIEKLASQYRQLLSEEWHRIAELRDNDPESAISISMSASVDCSGKTPVVKTKISYSQKFTSETEEQLDDPKQVKMEI